MICPNCKHGCLKFRYPKRNVEVEGKDKVKRQVFKRATNEVICTKCGYKGVA